jgi:hypothetical protein
MVIEKTQNDGGKLVKHFYKRHFMKFNLKKMKYFHALLLLAVYSFAF